MINENPLISVIMPVYNAEKYIDETINSILNQSFKNFEFIIIDDKSTDNSVKIIEKFNDKRIKFFKNESNIGYVKTLNKLIGLAKGKFIARQDNDDISLKKRLEIQYNYMINNPDVLLCGTNYKIFGNKNFKSNSPKSYEHIKSFFIFNNPICHPSVMIKKCIFNNISVRYDEKLCPSEDYALWFEISKIGRIVNLPYILLKYRTHNHNVSVTNYHQQVDCANTIRKNVFNYYFNYKLDQTEIKLLSSLFEKNTNYTKEDLLEIKIFFLKIENLNKKSNHINEFYLKYEFYKNWKTVVLKKSTINNYDRIKYFFDIEIFSIKFLFFNILETFKII